MARIHCAVLTFLAVLAPMTVIGQPLCRPNLALQETRYSEARDQQRTWTAVIAADASHCSATAGRFVLGFDRAIEYGPDLRFFETFEWRAGQSEVSFVFGHDEAPYRYWIAEIAPCGCRN